MRAPQLVIPVASALFGLFACSGDQGVPGNPGPQGDRGPTGATGPMGATGPAGPTGERGMDGLEGGTPVLLTNLQSSIIQFGDQDQVKEISRLTVVAPGDGGLLVRAHFSGIVAKRDGSALCRVTVGVRRDQEATQFLSQNVGVFGAPVAGRLELSVGTTLTGLMPVNAGQEVIFRLEVQRLDPECADGLGPTLVAQIFGQLEFGFHRYTLTTR